MGDMEEQAFLKMFYFLQEAVERKEINLSSSRFHAVQQLAMAIAKSDSGLYLECSGWGCNGRAGVPSRSLPFPFPSLEIGPWNPAGGAVSSPSGVWGGAQADKRFGAF